MANFSQDIQPAKKLKIGMVGGGPSSFFAGYHRAAMRLTNRFDLVSGSFSSDPLRSAETGEALGLRPDRTFKSFEDMVSSESGRADPIDAAVIVTPNHLHFEPCRQFLEAGIPLICDKPLVNKLDEANELVCLAKSRRRFVGVTYTYTGYPMVRDARARILRGDIGDIRFISVEYLLEWLADDQSALGSSGGGWRGDPAKAGPTGALGDIGTHAFQMTEFLSGRRCTALSARLSKLVPGRVLDDTNVVQLELEGGIEGLLWISLAAPGHRNGLKFKVIGSKGSLEWHQEAPETLRLGRLGEGDITFRRGQRDMTPEGAACVSLAPGNSEGYIEALAVLYSDFADAIAAGSAWRDGFRTPLPDVIDGARGVALSYAAVELDRSRSWVDFPQIG